MTSMTRWLQEPAEPSYCRKVFEEIRTQLEESVKVEKENQRLSLRRRTFEQPPIPHPPIPLCTETAVEERLNTSLEWLSKMTEAKVCQKPSSVWPVRSKKKHHTIYLGHGYTEQVDDDEDPF